MDGLDVVRGLRGGRRVPIVVLSGARIRDAPRSRRSTSVPTTTSRSRSAWTSCSPGCAPRSGVPSPRTGRPVVATADFIIDFAAKQVRRDGATVRLTPTQWHIVEVLVRNAGRLVTYEQLLQEVWGPTYGKETNYLRVFMTQIRQKLEPDSVRSALLHHGARHRLPVPATIGRRPRWLR